MTREFLRTVLNLDAVLDTKLNLRGDRQSLRFLLRSAASRIGVLVVRWDYEIKAVALVIELVRNWVSDVTSVQR